MIELEDRRHGKHGGQAERANMTAFIVTRDLEGISTGHHEDKMGLRSSNTTTVNGCCRTLRIRTPGSAGVVPINRLTASKPAYSLMSSRINREPVFSADSGESSPWP